MADDRKIDELRSQVRELRKEGRIKSYDLYTELFASITSGWLSPGNVSRALALLLVATIEFVSAFGPTVLVRYAEATKRCDGTEAPVTVRRIEMPHIARRAEVLQPPGRVMDYLAERVEQTESKDTVSETTLQSATAAGVSPQGASLYRPLSS